MFCGNKLIAMLGTAMFLIALSFPSMASTGTIRDVTIDIKIRNDESNSDINVTTNSNQYHIDKVSIADEEDNWSDGERSVLKICLKIDGDNTFFAGFSPKNVSITSSRVTLIGGRLNGSDLTLLLMSQIPIDDISSYDLKVSDLTMGDLEWDEENGTARWDPSGDVSYYEVKLYRGSNRIASTLTTQNLSYDFSLYITEEGDYAYKVRSISHSWLKGKWKKSDSWHVTSDEAKKISYGKTADIQNGPGISSSVNQNRKE